MPGEEKKSSSKYEGSALYKFIETNTQVKPDVYYNIGVFAVLYNRMKGDLQNQFEGDLSKFDTEIIGHIKDKLSKPKAEVEEWLKGLNYEGILKVYDDNVSLSQAKNIDPDNFKNSVKYFVKNYDSIVSQAREFTRLKYGNEKNKPSMISYDDVRDILKIKEEKSEFAFFEHNRKLLSNEGGLTGSGKLGGGPLTKAVHNAHTTLTGMKRNLNRGRLKAVGWTALTLGAGVLTGGLGFATLGLGGAALGGVFGALYTTSSAAATLGGIVATGGSGFVAYKGAQGFMARLGQNWKDRKKYASFKYSRGKYALAKDDELDKMGFKRLMDIHEEQLALEELYKNVSNGKTAEQVENEKRVKAGKKPKKRRGGKTIIKKDDDGNIVRDENGKPVKITIYPEPEDIDYVPKKYRKALKRYTETQKERFKEKARDFDMLAANAKRHKYVANRDLNPGEIGFYNLYKHMNSEVEGYEFSKLSIDEVIWNYTVDKDGKKSKSRLHPDEIRAHTGYPDEISYITARLNEYVSYEEDFKGQKAIGEFSKGLVKFVEAYNNSFNNSLFENAYTSKSLGDAANTMESAEFKKMIESTKAGTAESNLKSVISFLTAERDNNDRSVKVLSEAVGVGIEHQIDMSTSSLRKGCESLGDTTVEAQTAAAALASMNICSVKIEDGKAVRVADPAVVSAINSVANSKTKNYLNHILESKLISCKISNDSYIETVPAAEQSSAQGFASRIYGIRTSADATKIRRDIAASSLSVDIKTNLSEILDEQVVGLETEIRDEARVKAVKGIKKGSVKFKDLVEEIDKIETFEKSTLHTLWLKIEKVDDPDLLEYLKLRFKDRVAHELMEYATDTSKFGGENIDAQMKNIKDFLLKARALCPQEGVGDKFIDDWQLQECISALSVQVKTTLDAYLNELEMTFLIDTQKKKVNIKNLIEKPIPTGLKEFFDSKTPESEAILERAKRFALSADVYSFMTVSSIGGYTGLVDADSADSMAALNIYFKKNRDNTDTLLKLLQKLNADIKNTEINSRDPDIISALPELDVDNPFEIVRIGEEEIHFPKFASPTGSVYKCSRIIGESGNYDLMVPSGQMNRSFLYSTIQTLKSAEFVTAKPEERLATLAILKKKITAMMRVQMIQLYEQKRGSATTYPNFVHDHRTDLANNLVKDWKSVAMIIDTLIDNAKNHLSVEDQLSYNAVTSNTVEAIDALNNLDEYQRKVTETRVHGA